MHAEQTKNMRELQAAANALDGRALDYTNGLPEAERHRIRQKAEMLRREVYELARATLNNPTAEQMSALASLNQAAKNIQAQAAELKKAKKLLDDITTIVDAIDTLLELAA
jgi:Lon protease-like protein